MRHADLIMGHGAVFLQSVQEKSGVPGEGSRPARHRPIVLDQDRILVVRRRELHKVKRSEFELVSLVVVVISTIQTSMLCN